MTINIQQRVGILAEIRRLRYRPKIKGRDSPFKSTGGTYMMKIARVDAERILARARATKRTCAQIVNSREW